MQSQNLTVTRIEGRATPARRARAAALIVFVLALSLASPALGATVFLDPGHGGRYPGASYGGVQEKYVNLLIALETRKVLESRGYSVKMSRTSDRTVFTGDRPTWHWNNTRGTYFLYSDGKTGVYSNDGGGAIPYDDLQARCDAANASGAEIFISIHNNAGGSASGTESYYNNWRTDADAVLSNRLATFIQQGVVASAGTTHRKVDDVGYYVVRWANMPAALVEVAFLSNASDRAKLTDAAFRRRVATGIANGIDRYFASNPYAPLEPRLAGPDRYATSVAASVAGWPTGADTVLVASGDGWPDSLAAAPLSGALDAPVLLTSSSQLVPSVAGEISRLSPERVILLGGENALSPTVATAAAGAASIETSAVTRIAGRDRYQTAALIAETVGADAGTVMVVSGEAYPDAVSASAYAAINSAPILLTRTRSLSDEVSSFLAAHSQEVTRAVVVGGPVVVSQATVDSLSSRVTVDWLWGADRYATNRRVVERYWPTGRIDPIVATATNFPDALVAGPLGAKRGQPVILCGHTFLAGTTREWVMHNTDRIGSFTMIGGTSALSNLLEWELDKARGKPAP